MTTITLTANQHTVFSSNSNHVWYDQGGGMGVALDEIKGELRTKIKNEVFKYYTKGYSDISSSYFYILQDKNSEYFSTIFSYEMSNIIKYMNQYARYLPRDFVRRPLQYKEYFIEVETVKEWERKWKELGSPSLEVDVEDFKRHVKKNRFKYYK